ncbi:GntR family transcriptional regulator [Stappia sp. F7233]|uniref:GntR family transcriptional regulator n=1 Tax=Stappia albiluteola TaxID=2758565 RepID=A0A839ABY4_9HYPH|nr:GntR family transcriptional regulator [Stappia albiluteola]MBA5777220.1 GntR family transcriptional regulator [Stappia albiluteola]
MLSHTADTARDDDPAIAAAEDESRAALAYRKLEEMIVTLKLAPGSAITEASLAAALGMGRTPIREAVQRLSWEGLLTIRPRLGIVVSEINPGDFARVLDARHAVEVLLAGAAARFASRAERDVLADCAQAMRDAAAANDVLGFMARDKQFDEVVAVAACNPFAARVAAPLQTHSRRFWFRYFGDSDLAAAAFHHMELMRAIGAGDEPRATAKAEELMQYLRRQAARLTSG